MSIDARDEFIRDRAARALGKHRVEDAVNKVKAIIGPANIPDSQPLAQSAFDKLRNGEKPTPEELTALEIVVRLLRPVLFSRSGGALEDLPDRPPDARDLYPEQLKDAWNTFRARIKPYMRSIGRIETSGGKHIGTGFLVDDELLATNRHVLDVLTYGSEALASGSARVVFRQEYGYVNSAEDIVRIDGLATIPPQMQAAIHPLLDMVLLAVPATGRPAVDFELQSMPQSASVVAIGFPGNDPENNPLFLTSVFNGRYGYKAASLGEVMDNSSPATLIYDCSTTQGNSGSPVFSLATARVAGIHRAGRFMYRNEAVIAEELRKFVQTAKPQTNS